MTGKKYVRTLAAGLLMLTPVAAGRTVAHATEPLRAVDLVAECEGHGLLYANAKTAGMPDPGMFGAIDVMTCAAYLEGIADLNAVIAGMLGQGLFCFPPTGLSGAQQLDVFLDWAKRHPERLHESRRSAVVRAFGAAFPCDEEHTGITPPTS